jgi:hypothetical protein
MSGAKKEKNRGGGRARNEEEGRREFTSPASNFGYH